MKVLMISTDRKIFEEGSAVRQRMAEYAGLIEELHIIVFTGSGFEEEKIAENARAYPTNSWLKFFYVFNAADLGAEIIKEETSKDWLVTCQDPFETGYAGLKLLNKVEKAGGKSAKPRFEVQIHTDFLSPYFKKHSILNRIRLYLAGEVLPEADCIRVVSGRVKDSLLNSSEYRINCEPTVLPIYVDKESIKQKEPAFDLHEKYPQFNFIVLMASRLESEKDIGMALAAFAEVLKKYHQAGMVIVGSGGQEKKLKKTANSLGIEESVVFEGASQDLVSFYKTANAFLNTSLYEGYNRSIVEAGLAGLPIITTDVGVAGCLLEDGDTALVCPVGDKECISEKIIQLIENNSQRLLIGHTARQLLDKQVSGRQAYLKALEEAWKNCGK